MGEALSLISIGNPAAMTTGFFFSKIALIFVAGAAGSVIMGVFTKASPENILIAGLITGIFVNMVADFWAVITITNGFCEAFTAPYSSCAWITWTVFAMFAPLAIMFGMAMVDWWRGTQG